MGSWSSPSSSCRLPEQVPSGAAAGGYLLGRRGGGRVCPHQEGATGGGRGGTGGARQLPGGGAGGGDQKRSANPMFAEEEEQDPQQEGKPLPLQPQPRLTFFSDWIHFLLAAGPTSKPSNPSPRHSQHPWQVAASPAARQRPGGGPEQVRGGAEGAAKGERSSWSRSTFRAT